MAEADPSPEVAVTTELAETVSENGRSVVCPTEEEAHTAQTLDDEGIITAREHIQQIRRERGVDEDIPDHLRPRNFEDLRASCDVVSDQLNTADTHFLLEFIQNADDNTYDLPDDETPTLKFSASPGKLHITCNETGFLHENVEAICNLGRSSKANRHRGYIGEKGLGFKSVFKVAKVVHIASGNYSFKFDRDALLGIVTPVWSHFPIETEKGQTNFLLEICIEGGGQNAERDFHLAMRKLDHCLLLFLRKLRQISILFDEGRGIGGKWVRHIRREDSEQYAGQMVTIGEQKKRYKKLEHAIDYLLVRHVADGMPEAKRRPGITTSEVVLAFPFQNSQPTFFKRKAYAFLPIRESGFKFLIQADFLLNAAREDVLINDWNQALLNALAQCFLVAVNRFNHPDAHDLRYCWPGFLLNVPSDESEDFFASLSANIFETLRHQPILEGCGESFVRPIDAIFVPQCYRQDGIFILDGLDDAATRSSIYISSRYGDHDPKLRVLQRLGVNTLEFPKFLDLLAERIAKNFEEYESKDPSWHSALAKILQKVSAVDWDAAKEQLKSLRLIPLQNSEWVSISHGKQSFFNIKTEKSSHKLPVGIEEIWIVQDNVSNDPVRRKLLEKLGVKELTRVEVCRMTLDHHANERPPKLEPDDIIFHAQYMFETSRAGSNLPPAKRFWVHDVRGTPRLATSVYCDSAEPLVPKISDTLPVEQWSSLLLHRGYSVAYTGEVKKKWVAWMESFFQLSTVLRIVDHECNFTSEFRFVLENRPSAQMLDILVSSMNKNSAELASKSTKDLLRTIKVLCEDDHKYRLDTTFLPSSNMKKTGVTGLPFVCLENAGLRKWRILKELDVIIDPDLNFYLRCLKIISELPAPITAVSITELYLQIELEMSRTNRGAEEVRKFFNQRVVYLYTKNTWCSKGECVWKHIPGLDQKQVLSTLYPKMASFFVTNLLIDNGTIEMIVNKLQLMVQPGQDDASMRKPLLFTLNNFLLEKPNDFSKLRPLENIPVMPLAGKSNIGAGNLASLNKATWCFSDINDYYDSFVGLDGVNFADFSIEEFPKLQHLADAIKDAWPLEGQRRLSQLVKRIDNVDVDAAYSSEWTNFLFRKMRFIRRIIRHAGGSDLDRKLKALESLQVFLTPNLAYTPTFTRGQLGKPIRGRPIKRLTVHKYKPGGNPELSIFVRANTERQLLLDCLSEEICGFSDVKTSLKMYMHKVMMYEDSDIHDILLRGRIEGHETQPYSPPVAPVIQNHATDTSQRLPLEPQSINIIQPAKPISLLPTTAENCENQPPEPEVLVKDRIARALQFEPTKLPGTTLLAHNTSVSHREAIQSSRLSELEDGNIKIGGFPKAIPAATNSSISAHIQQNNENQVNSHAGFNVQNRHQVNIFVPLDKNIVRNLAPVRVSEKFSRDIKAKSKYDLDRELKIGIKGEKYMWTCLNDIFGDGVKENWWTSELRSMASLGLSKWRPDDPTLIYCDFTVPDVGGKFTNWLLEIGVMVPPTNPSRTYHIEVKATAGSSDESCHMSGLQMSFCQELSGSENNVFLLCRIYGINSANPGIEIHADPWKLMEDGRLSKQVDSWLVHFK